MCRIQRSGRLELGNHFLNHCPKFSKCFVSKFTRLISKWNPLLRATLITALHIALGFFDQVVAKLCVKYIMIGLIWLWPLFRIVNILKNTSALMRQIGTVLYITWNFRIVFSSKNFNKFFFYFKSNLINPIQPLLIYRKFCDIFYRQFMRVVMHLLP